MITSDVVPKASLGLVYDAIRLAPLSARRTALRLRAQPGRVGVDVVLDAVARDLAHGAVPVLRAAVLVGAIAEQRACPGRWLGDVALGELVADLAYVVVDFGDPCLQAGALLLDRRRRSDRALQPVGLAVQRGDLLVGAADGRRQAGALGGVGISLGAQRTAGRRGQLLEAIGDVAALRLDARAVGDDRVELTQVGERQRGGLRREAFAFAL